MCMQKSEQRIDKKKKWYKFIHLKDNSNNFNLIIITVITFIENLIQTSCNKCFLQLLKYDVFHLIILYNINMN